MSNLIKVVSGFQTGADIAGVTVAKLYGLETGGYIPKYYRTLDGNKPEYKEMFNAVEHSSTSYADRTEDNVFISDGTVRFFYKSTSAGERCTLNAIRLHGKPYFDVDFNKDNDVDAFLVWLNSNSIKVLNVAGNSEQTAPGIYNEVFAYLSKALSRAGLTRTDQCLDGQLLLFS